MICEGSYPFVAGGVSSWLQALIAGMPEHQFHIWAIGAQEAQRGKLAYALPDNVVSMTDIYLDAARAGRGRGTKRLTGEQYAAARALLSCGTPDWPVLFELFGERGARGIDFLSSRDFLALLEEISAEDYPFVGFTDYFWTVRSMFLPLMYLLGGEIPEADLYYAVSAGYAGVLGAMARLRTGKPFVLTEHGIYTREREEEILQSDWVPPQYKDLWINMFYLFARCAYRYADKVTALFNRASLIQQEIGCPAGKCAVVPNGVNHMRLADVPVKQPTGTIDIGAVVRLVPIKDIKTMLFAFALVGAERKDVRLHIMGPTEEDEAYYEECLRLKDDLGLENVLFTGRVDVVKYLGGIDFTLLTSISEGQPLAVLESMAAGRPAVTTDVGSCRELLEGVDDDCGPAGLCVPVMHQGALAEAMLALCSDEALRVRMGENGRRRVHERYRRETMLARYRAIFDEVGEVTRDGGHRV